MRNLALSLGCLILSSACLAQAPNWVQVKPTNSPPARWVHGSAYDFLRGRTIVFGGGPRRQRFSFIGDDVNIAAGVVGGLEFGVEIGEGASEFEGVRRAS